jgi:hypothetical protein
MDARDDQRCAAQTTVAVARGSRREEIRGVMRRRVVVQRGYGMRCGEDVCMRVSTKERLVRWGAGWECRWRARARAMGAAAEGATEATSREVCRCGVGVTVRRRRAKRTLGRYRRVGGSEAWSQFRSRA